MGIAISLREFLDSSGVAYEVVEHPYMPTSREAAAAARVPAAQMAKSVLLEDDDGYMMAVVPADRRVDLDQLERRIGRRLMLATESELKPLFRDCVPGAIPPVGRAYGLEMVWDDSLSRCGDVYFEAGDHTDLVHVSGRDFRTLMGSAAHGAISRPA